MGDMKIYFPQWQGSGNRALYTGAAAARKGLNLKSRLKEIKMASDENLVEENGILGYRQILEQLKKLGEEIDSNQPNSILTLGGGCDIEVLPVSYLNKKYEGDLSVIWLDAHGDLNSPKTSKTAHFHGMPLRFLLEEGNDKGIDELMYSRLEPQQLLLLGVRDLDEPEKEYIAEKSIPCMSVQEVAWTEPGKWISSLHENVYVHIDLDVLDGKSFPHTLSPTDLGLEIVHLTQIMRRLQEERRIVGMSILEYASSDPSGIEGLKDVAAMGLWI